MGLENVQKEGTRTKSGNTAEARFHWCCEKAKQNYHKDDRNGLPARRQPLSPNAPLPHAAQDDDQLHARVKPVSAEIVRG